MFIHFCAEDRVRTVKWGHLLLILLILLMLLPRPVSATPARQAPPALLSLAAARPTQTVRVIIQKAGHPDPAAERKNTVESAIVQVAGVITRDLSMINAFVAEVPAGALPALAARSDVRWISLDTPVVSTAAAHHVAVPRQANGNGSQVQPLLNTYIPVINADKAWQRGLQGQGVTVAVVDSGITDHDDFKAVGGNLRIKQWVQYSNSQAYHPDDYYGHGSHIAGVIGGNGALSGGAYVGVAPQVNLINVKITNDYGAGAISDVVAGLQWIYNNRAAYNIRVVNLSLNSSAAEPYHLSPLNAAVEILWFSGIVVVVSAGNNGTTSGGVLYPPANDPFVITVGATKDNGTLPLNDDAVAPYSAYGVTPEGFAKPDLVAPGHNIVSLMGKPNAVLAQQHPGNRQADPVQSNYFYFRMSGTSAAAPMVAGAAALLLQDEPGLTPDQVKHRLMTTANRQWQGYDAAKAGAGLLDIQAAINGNSIASANTGIPASQLLWSGPMPVAWNSVSWNSVSWNSVSWNSVSWNSVSWNSVSWNSDYWGP